MAVALIIPAFIAGVLTFLAPCTLPLVPGYLGFISGVSINNFSNQTQPGHRFRHKVLLNGALYVIGFSLVFIFLGSLFGLGGAALSKYRFWLSRIGGAFVVFFGSYLTGILRLPLFNFLEQEHRLNLTRKLTPGQPLSSLIFGATFAFGWGPCVGPVLGSVLLLASSSATVVQGALLLGMFSLGLAVPFLILAFVVESASTYIQKMNHYLNTISIIGGVFLIFLGTLLLTNTFPVWLSFFYRHFKLFNYNQLLNYM